MLVYVVAPMTFGKSSFFRACAEPESNLSRDGWVRMALPDYPNINSKYCCCVNPSNSYIVVNGEFTFDDGWISKDNDFNKLIQQLFKKKIKLTIDYVKQFLKNDFHVFILGHLHKQLMELADVRVGIIPPHDWKIPKGRIRVDRDLLESNFNDIRNGVEGKWYDFYTKGQNGEFVDTYLHRIATFIDNEVNEKTIITTKNKKLVREI